MKNIILIGGGGNALVILSTIIDINKTEIKNYKNIINLLNSSNINSNYNIK